MNDNIPVHLRIAGLAPTNEDVDSRRAAVAKLATAWSKISNVDQIVKKAADIAQCLGGEGTPTAEFGSEIQAAVQKHASAFLYVDRPLEVGVCAGMAVVSMMKSELGKSGWTITDVYANALWSALAFQPPLSEEKRENLRREVLDCAVRWSLQSAELARERDDVADPIDLVVTISEVNKSTTNYKQSITGTIGALRRNAALDREEIDFLWWSQLSRSRLLNRPLASISEGARLVASGIEAARHLRRLPAETHRDLVLRTTDADPELNLAELMSEIENDRHLLSEGVYKERVISHPTIFPLLNAIVTGEVGCKGADEKRKASTWGARALLEGALSKMMAIGRLDK
jgi:hypothetical protein